VFTLKKKTIYNKLLKKYKLNYMKDKTLLKVRKILFGVYNKMKMNYKVMYKNYN
jgi:hypothetical protein